MLNPRQTVTYRDISAALFGVLKIRSEAYAGLFRVELIYLSSIELS
jgi:hypothetical protein